MRAVVGLVVVSVIVLVAVMASRLVASFQIAAAQDQKMTSSFVPNPNKEIALMVRGWSRPEFDQILADFLKLYSLPNASGLRLEARANDFFVVTFPGDIQPSLLFFLINYVQYPKSLSGVELNKNNDLHARLGRKPVGVVI